MSANLYPGIKSLHLVLDTPYDLIRTDDVRDDLIGVKVWYSTTPNFDPKAQQGTLAFDGSGLSITISELEVNTQYYVKYAFISAIDPTIFTVSAQLTATVYDETANIYGYLTNDPSSVFTDQDGSGGDYTTTQGVFKVFELSQDVTGAGPVYSIKPGGITGGVSGVIDPVTGFYYATAMTSNTGTITFYASYKDVVVEKIWNLTKIRDGVDGTDAPNLRVSSTGNSFVYKDDFAQTSESGSLTISTALTNLIGTPTYTAFAYTRAGVLLGPITLTLQGSQAILTASNFNPPAYNNTVGYVTITSQLALVSDSITIYRNNDGSEQITVEQSNQAHTISAFTDGTVPLANYSGSGNIIRVKQGNTYLLLDNFSPYPNGTWRLTAINSVGITADPTPTVGVDYVNFDQHANMLEDVAYIDYEVTGKTTTGKSFVLTVRQSFSKSKAGVEGSDAPVVNLTATTQTFVVAKNTGLVTPATSTITATVTNMVNETIAWYIDDVLQAGQTSSVFSVASFTGAPKIVKAIATSGVVTAFDQLTLFSLREGDDALQAGLENENQTISCDSSGEPIAGQLPVASRLVVVRGAQVLTTGVVYSLVEQVNVTATINASTGVISVSAINANSGYAVFRATVDGVALDKRLTLAKSLNGQNGTRGVQGPPAPSLDFSGTTTFYRNSGGLITPGSATLTAIALNTTSPSFSWSVSGATPASGTGTSITITPTGLSLSITVSLTITAANLPDPVVIAKTMGIVEQGAPGQVGQNGTMSAYPSIFQWTSGATPARPTTTSNYIWSTGTWTAPSGWTTQPTSNTNSGWVLWEITVPLNVEATTTQSTLNWASTSFPIRATTANGTNGTPGTPGDPGSPGANGSATYLIDRGSVNSSSAPTRAEVLAATGFRYAQLGDIATIRYNSGNNSTAYRATSSGFSANWALQTTYITGSLIVTGSISAEKLSAGTFTSDGDLFRTTLGTTTFVDGIGVSWLLGYYGRRTESAGVSTGPVMGIDDVSTNPGTYAFYAISAKGGAAKFQGQAGNGSNIVMISGNKPDGLVIHPENGSPTANGVHVQNTTSPVGFKVTKTTGTLLQQNAFNGEGNFYSVATGSGAGLYINNTYPSANGFGAIIRTASSAPAIQCENYGTGAGLYSIGSIYSSSDIVAFYSSDITLKTNIVKIPNALEKLRQLGGYTYDWKDEVLAKKGGEDGYFVRKQDVGVIAQEVQKVLPEIVATRSDGTLGVRYERLIALVIEAIKELDGKIK
jgi:hypothetical protein